MCIRDSSYISDGYANAVPGYYKNNWAVIIYGYSDMSSANSAASSLNGIALSPNDVIILDMGGNPILLISNSDAYFMGDSGSVPVVDLGARSYRGIIDFMQNDNGTFKMFIRDSMPSACNIYCVNKSFFFGNHTKSLHIVYAISSGHHL